MKEEQTPGKTPSVADRLRQAINNSKEVLQKMEQTVAELSKENQTGIKPPEEKPKTEHEDSLR